MKKLILTKLMMALFFLIVAIDSLGIILGEMTIRFIFKPLISPTLLTIYLITTPKINKLYVVALCFAFTADTLLLSSSNGYFVIALGFFLLMHLTYIMIITNTTHSYNTKSLSLAAIPFFTVLFFVMFFVFNNINDFLWPILVYGVVVCIFSALTFYYYLEKKSNTSLLLLLGSFFFIISNSMSAIEKFSLQNKDLSVVVMWTYVLAQFLIFRYMVKKAEAI